MIGIFVQSSMVSKELAHQGDGRDRPSSDDSGVTRIPAAGIRRRHVQKMEQEMQGLTQLLQQNSVA